MIKLKNILRQIKVKNIFVNNNINYKFSRGAKSTQLILHTSGDI